MHVSCLIMLSRMINGCDLEKHTLLVSFLCNDFNPMIKLMLLAKPVFVFTFHRISTNMRDYYLLGKCLMAVVVIAKGNCCPSLSTSWGRRWWCKENGRSWSIGKCWSYFWAPCRHWLAHRHSGLQTWPSYGREWLLWGSDNWKGRACCNPSAYYRSNFSSIQCDC